LTISGEFVKIELIEPAKAMLAKVTSKWRVVALMDQTRRQPYNKPAITYEEQVELLQQRGMIIEDIANAEFCLQHINYYRLTAYWLPFEEDHETHKFRPNTSFDEVLALYNFDRELRLLILDAIERIEVSVRAHWSYQLGHLHGPHAHLNSALFNDRYWKKNLDQLTEEVRRSSKERFIKHYQNNYKEVLPPVWVVSEVMSFGLLSRWYKSLITSTRNLVSKVYDLDYEIFVSWLYHLSSVRNLCAHHSRIWNRNFEVSPTLVKNETRPISSQFVCNSKKIYNTLIILLYFMDRISPGHSWREKLISVIKNDTSPITSIDCISAMDFPENWTQSPLWQVNSV
jgi:abortive infection bacteriophage resistance protein